MKVYNKEIVRTKERKKSLFKFLQQTATMGTWKVDLKTMETTWCSITKRIHEVEDNYIPSVNTGISFYKEGHSRDTITRVVKNCIEEFEKYDVELQIITAKGNVKWVRAIGLPVVENGECIVMHGLFQDITEKNNALKELAYKEEQFRKTFEYAVLGMAILDLRGRWIKVNSSLCNMLKCEAPDFETKTFLDFIYPDDKSLDKSAQLLRGEIDNYQTETRLLNKEGDIVWTMISVSLIRNDLGQPQNFVAQINDISNFKNASERVINLLSTSESQNQRLLNFAHIVSHNLRSHYSNLAMLLNIMGAEDPKALQNSFYPYIKTAVDNLGETLENLSDVAVLNTNKHDDVEQLKLKKYVKSAITSVEAILNDCKAKINISIPNNLEVLAIPAYLESIALNFITNAIKYNHPDRRLVVDISTKISDGFVILKIEDNGLGIDLKKHGSKLFGMYKTFHEHEDARGLGLFITKNQVEALGGEIKVKSKVNEGTVFKVYLRHEKD